MAASQPGSRKEIKIHGGKITTGEFDGTLDDLHRAYVRFRDLTELARQITSETSMDRVLDKTLDRLIAHTSAERGLLLLMNHSGGIVYQKGRNLAKEDIADPAFEVSWSIIRKTQKTGEAVCIRDALESDDFKLAKSVHRLNLLSVLCVPIIYQSVLVGVFYADHRHLEDLFTQEECGFVQQSVQFVAGHLYSMMKNAELEQDLQKLRQQVANRESFKELIGNSPKLKEILSLVEQVSDTTATVLIEGASGTGKELVARALHENSGRRDHPFISLNCGALPETLLESELFGYARGAFTGALHDKKGWFETADGGTIFFDEISEMSPSLQVKLLRVLQTGEFSPVGSHEIHKCDVRILAATNVHLSELVSSGRFRPDLFYRLNIINIPMPTLRERPEDILLLASHFLEKHRLALGKERIALDEKVQQRLLDYDFPGNVRELENAMQRAAVLCQGDKVLLQHLPESMQFKTADGHGTHGTFAERKQRVVEQFEKDFIVNALKDAEGVVAKAARLAGMNAKNFFQKMEKFGIQARFYKT